MRTSPVSFKSLMVFTTNDGRAKLPIPDFMKLTFSNNPELKEFNLDPKVKTYDSEQIDGTIHNASKSFAIKLDERYAKALPKGSKDVYLTKADFLINPAGETKTKYFLTAATEKDEEKIHNILSGSRDYFVAKFKYRK